MRHNVTTPGGFFVGLGGIAAFCAVAVGVNYWVSKPTPSNEFESQKLALGFVAKSEEKEKQKEIDALIKKASDVYNGGKTLDLNNLDDLRGIVRFREAHVSNVESVAILATKSSVEGKTVLQAAIAEVVKEIAAKKPTASTVKIDLLPPPADAPISMPNVQGKGANTVIFPPITAPAPSPTSAPAPGTPQVEKPQASVSQPAQTVAAVPAPSRPPIFNWSDSK
jgi:hypothetical protein